MKKVVSILLTIVLSLGLLGSVAFAVNPAYAFNLQNTGQTYTVDTGSGNYKQYLTRGWTLYVTSISVVSGSAGMSFVPCRLVGSTYYVSGTAHWRKVTGKTTGTYAGHTTYNETYYLAARIDDLYSGPFSAAGTWNADT